MKEKILLISMITATMLLVPISLVKAGTVDVAFEPICIIIHAPDEVVVGKVFSIIIGIQSMVDLVVDDFLIEVRDAHNEKVYGESIFEGLFVGSYKPPIEKTITVSISREGNYGCFTDFVFTVKGERHSTNLAYFTLGYVRTIDYESLKTTYSSLKSDYDNLTSDYDKLKLEHESTIKQLSTNTNLMYVLIVTTMAFIATTGHFARRKPKTT